MDWEGFEWLVADDNQNNVVVFLRRDKKGREMMCAVNFSPNHLRELPLRRAAPPAVRAVCSTRTTLPVAAADAATQAGIGVANPSHGKEQSLCYPDPAASARCFCGQGTIAKPSGENGERRTNMKKECIAMLLAGGQGSRLYVLTGDMAKPAVPFGGKFRIIDFPLSNCTNSGIDTVGVLTQYRPLELNSYIGSGQPWDLDRIDGGVHILPPYQVAGGATWYKGTANAIYQNIGFIDLYDPDYVVILSGDHIYKMDYSRHAGAAQARGRRLHHLRHGGALGRGHPLRHHERGRRGHHHGVRRKAQGAQEQSGLHGHLRVHLEEAAAVSDRGRGRPQLGKRLRQEHHSRHAGCGEKMAAYRFERLLEGRGHPGVPVGRQYGHAVPGLGAGSAGPDWPIYARTPTCRPPLWGSRPGWSNSAVSQGCDGAGRGDELGAELRHRAWTRARRCPTPC